MRMHDAKQLRLLCPGCFDPIVFVCIIVYNSGDTFSRTRHVAIVSSYVQDPPAVLAVEFRNFCDV